MVPVTILCLCCVLCIWGDIRINCTKIFHAPIATYCFLQSNYLGHGCVGIMKHLLTSGIFIFCSLSGSHCFAFQRLYKDAIAVLAVFIQLLMTVVSV